MAWVLDCSLALAWGLPDEISDRAEQLLPRIFEQGNAQVPALWWYELANGLTTAIRRQRITEDQGLQLIELYAQLPIETDSDHNPPLLRRLQVLARAYDLSAYDAAYLELAQREGIGLVSLDTKLRHAAKASGVRVLC